jgi:HEAT repeat protein
MEALQLLLNDLEDENRALVWEAATQLQSIGVEIVSGALKLLKNAKRAETRAAAAYVLGSCRLASARIHLEQTLENSDEAPSVRSHAAEALGYLQSRESVAVLLRQLEDKNTGVKYSSILALGEIGDQFALPPLRRLLLKIGDQRFEKRMLRDALLDTIAQLSPPEDENQQIQNLENQLQT